jgi:adenylate cyclase
MMAVFPEPASALESILAAQGAVGELDVDGYRPQLRAGIHTGRAQRVGDDYFGVDVNVAARVAEQASAGEVLITHSVLQGLDDAQLAVRQKRFFRGKGVPNEIKVHSVKV